MTTSGTSIEPIQAPKHRLTRLFGRLPRWAWISLALASVIAIAGALAIAMLASSNARLSSQKDELISSNQTLVSENQRLTGVNDAAKQRAADAEARAQTANARARLKAEHYLASRRAKLDARAAALDKTQATLASRAADLTRQENVVAASTFSDGVYLVGTDIPAGSYVGEGGSSCYWERSYSGGDIIDNYYTGSSGQVRVIINDGEQFDTTGCGVWSPG
jgi:hypothetical protein